MKPLSHTVAFALAILSFSSLNLQAAEAVTVEEYHYGMQLDVQKVLAQYETPSRLCEVVAARMDYLDSQGRQRSLSYLINSSACKEAN